MTSHGSIIARLREVNGSVAIKDGILTFEDGTTLELPKPNDAIDAIYDLYIQTAKIKWEEAGECEIDDDAVVSISDDGGAYVQAWVWVYDNDQIKQRKEAEDPSSNENGYAIYPRCILQHDRVKAIEIARVDSIELGEARVEDCDTEKTIAKFSAGERIG